MSMHLLARVRWANVLRSLGVLAVVPLVVAAMDGGVDAPSVPSGAVRVAPAVTDTPDPPVAAQPTKPPEPRVRPRRRRRHRRARQPRVRPIPRTPAPVVASPAPPAPSPAAEFRP